MCGLSKTLNALVPWTRVLDLLGIAAPRPILPAIVYCPLCKQEQLNIVEEYLAGGQWFHCRKCKKFGDMIELAARTWDLSIAATIQKLSQQGFDLSIDSDTVRSYLTQHIEYRGRIGKLWEQARQYIFNESTTLGSIFSALRLANRLRGPENTLRPSLPSRRCLAIMTAKIKMSRCRTPDLSDGRRQRPARLGRSSHAQI